MPQLMPRLNNGARRQFYILLALTVGILAIALYGNLKVIRSPVNIVTYTTSTPEICAGEPLTVDMEAHIVNAPSVIVTVTSIWDVDDKRNIGGDSAPRYRIWTEPGWMVVRNGEIPMPQLHPGNYEHRIALFAMGTEPEVAAIPFTVKECE